MLINNEINAGQMMSYLAATQMIQRSFTQLSILFGTALRGMSSGARVFEVLIIYINSWIFSHWILLRILKFLVP